MTPLDLAKHWYSYSLPDKLDGNFAAFAAKSASLAHLIAPGFLRIDPKATTAYIDANGITYLPQKYFNPEFYAELGVKEEDYTAAAITIINGSTIHEALHRLWTSPFLVLIKTIDKYLADGKFANPKTTEFLWLTNRFTEEQRTNASYKYEESIRRIDGDQELYKGSVTAQALAILDETTFFCIQIIEDIFNENKARTKFPAHASFMDAKNELLFTKKFEDMKAKIQEELKLETLLNLLITYKLESIRNDDIWKDEFMQPMVEIFELTKNPDLTNLDRTKLAVKLSYIIQNNEDVDQSEGSGQSVGKLIDSQSETEGGPEPDSKGDEEERDLAETFSSMIAEGELRSMKLDDDSTILPEHSFDLSQIPPVQLVDVEKAYSRGARSIEYNTDFLKFAQILRYSLESKHVYGPVRERGPEISKKFLNRISFDSRIFTRKDVIGREKGKPEVILLCDSSGSMTYKDIKNEVGSSESLMTAALRAAYGAHTSMIKSAIPNAVYSHTTAGSRNDDAPMVYAIAAYQMPFMSKNNNRLTTTRLNKERFSKAASVSNNNNYDGFAIREASQHFSSSETDKILIVMSDGQPSATNYGGQAAIQHTKTIVNLLRRKGFKVFSMSLIREVVEINDFIYGQEFNMRAFGNNMTKNMEECLRRAILM